MYYAGVVSKYLNTNFYIFRLIFVKQRKMTAPENKSSSDNNMNVTDDINTVHLLSKGLLEVYEPPLVTLKTHLKELTEKQEAVHTMITSERHQLEDLQNDAMLDALLADIATNKEKLNSISNSMVAMHKRVQSLQVRAANVEKVAKSRANQQKPRTI